ncbi:MAG: FeoA family protein [bacterium]|jgi:ferrous iron transport protein A
MLPDNHCHAVAKPLGHLTPGTQVLVVQLKGQGAIRHRLLDLGITPGTKIQILYRSPLGDPTAYLIRGATIALRSEEANLILVQPVNK